MRGLSLLLSIGLCLGLLPGCSRTDAPSQLSALQAQFDRGEYAKVIRDGEVYLKQHPESFRGWTLVGWAHVKTDSLDKANECFEAALRLNPKWDNAYVGQGVRHRQRGELDQARQSYQKAIELSPNNAEAFASLLVIELKQGNDAKAVEYGEKAWALRKNYAAIPANLAVAYHYLGDPKKRDAYYDEAAKLGYANLQDLKDIFEGKKSIR